MVKSLRESAIHPVYPRRLKVLEISDLTPALRRIVFGGQEFFGQEISAQKPSSQVLGDQGSSTQQLSGGEFVSHALGGREASAQKLSGQELASHELGGQLPDTQQQPMKGSLPAFLSTGFDDDVRIIFPHPDTGKLPNIETDEHGQVRWNEELKALFRAYTVRKWDGKSLTIDFARHTSGLAEDWTKTAQIGDELIIVGPRHCAAMPRDCENMVLIGDHTALPAISRCLEDLPEGFPVTVAIEIPSAADELELTTQANAQVTWIHKDNGGKLKDAIRHLAIPPGKTFVWAAGEANALKQVRARCKELGIPPERREITGYWRMTEGDAGGSVEIPLRLMKMADLGPGLALRTAARLGVFSAIDQLDLAGRPANVLSVAQLTGVDGESLVRLARYLEALGLLKLELTGGEGAQENGGGEGELRPEGARERLENGGEQDKSENRRNEDSRGNTGAGERQENRGEEGAQENRGGDGELRPEGALEKQDGRKNLPEWAHTVLHLTALSAEISDPESRMGELFASAALDRELGLLSLLPAVKTGSPAPFLGPATGLIGSSAPHIPEVGMRAPRNQSSQSWKDFLADAADFASNLDSLAAERAQYSAPAVAAVIRSHRRAGTRWLIVSGPASETFAQHLADSGEDAVVVVSAELPSDGLRGIEGRSIGADSEALLIDPWASGKTEELLITQLQNLRDQGTNRVFLSTPLAPARGAESEIYGEDLTRLALNGGRVPTYATVSRVLTKAGYRVVDRSPAGLGNDVVIAES